MNANSLNSSKSNPLPPSKPKSGAGDLSSAEMPEVIVESSQDDESKGNIPAPLTVADVEGGELKPISRKVDPQKPNPQDFPIDPEIAQVRFKTLDGRLNLLLPSEPRISHYFAEKQEADNTVGEAPSDPQAEGGIKDEALNLDAKLEDAKPLACVPWEELMTQLEQRMAASGHDWKPRTQVYLQSGDRLLDTRQLHQIAEALDNHQLLLHCVVTNRRQTAINAASMGFSVEQGTIFKELLGFNPLPDAPMDDPLYVKTTVRSGTEIRHSGSIIIFGDVNAGAELISESDIIVWGKLKGMAHAGVKGNTKAVVMALHLDATQIRIAGLIARVESPSTYFSPEVAFIGNQDSPEIQIVQAVDYSSKNRD
ncbi:septum site-determining protein MinC [Pseudanabaena mucicola]|uniref:Probable septum site-determining protein MinC n=1 Tax=Pseudanabaena mucicola FACHB-723 TaxID=2692860 RepID=A0ABR7ZYI6_9CYAN|nr:septum site-determining protein MinC [Pseudanabaena mucicola]MBD2188535.1 septum site-determining protein MinC [Pseudanabaena mucicola FACHB-723]